MINLKERYEEILEKKFTGAGGILKKYVIVVFDKYNLARINEFEYDTEEEATIAYGTMLKEYEFHREDVLLTIRYFPSL